LEAQEQRFGRIAPTIVYPQFFVFKLSNYQSEPRELRKSASPSELYEGCSNYHHAFLDAFLALRYQTKIGDFILISVKRFQERFKEKWGDKLTPHLI
jgi:hypothetical protein